MGRAFEYRKASKFARWDKMAKAFTKAGREINMAIKQSGANPDANLALRRAIQNAKAVQMPKDRIDAAIKRASSKDAEDLKEIVYEGIGPHGVAFVIETTTDNPVRTVANVRLCFNKLGGSLGMSNMHDFIFDRKGVFFIKRNLVENEEELEFSLIDGGLDKLELDEQQDAYIIYVDFKDFGKMQETLEQLKLPIEKSELQRIPNMIRDLTEEQIDEVLELVDRLEQDNDVQNVFVNLA